MQQYNVPWCTNYLMESLNWESYSLVAALGEIGFYFFFLSIFITIPIQNEIILYWFWQCECEMEVVRYKTGLFYLVFFTSNISFHQMAPNT